MFSILKQPYPRNDDFRYHLKIAFAISLFVILFLLFFKPFGLSNPETENINWIIAGYGMITFLTLLIVARLFKLIFNRFMNEENWTAGKEIVEQLLYIFFIGLGNLFYSHFVYGLTVSFYSFINFQFFTLLIGVFPVTFFVLRNQILLLKQNEQAAKEINKDITTPVHLINSQYKLTSENEKDVVNVDSDSMLFIEAADNYCTVYFMEQGKVKSQLLRSSLKRLEEQLRQPNIIRCHRTYIVNLLKIKSVSGNAQGYRLKFEHFDQTIPVSRNLNGEIKQKLSHLHSIRQTA